MGSNSTVISVLQIYDGCCFHFCLGFNKAAHVEQKSVRYMMPTPLAWSTAASDIKAAIHIENSVGAITQPCFTPVLMLNDPDCSPSYSTHPFMPSCSCRVMLTHLGGHPSRTRHAHGASLFTESNTLVRSMLSKEHALVPCISPAPAGQRKSCP